MWHPASSIAVCRAVQGMGQGGLCALGLWDEKGSSLTACAEEGKGVTAVLLLLFRLHQNIRGFSLFNVKSCES